MKKEDFLKQIAETAYNIGFGAKKHFATYDITKKIPGLISFISIAVGIFALYIDELAVKNISATLVIFGVIGVYISSYDSDDYNMKGKKLTKHFDSLKLLYYEVKSSSNENNQDKINQFKAIQNELNSLSESKQILFGDWYAHYKFFWQHQVKWIDDELEFKLFRDKIPLSLTITIIPFALLIIWA